ncbi:hypothetical protein [Halochromatium roseum]|nr:hypothetical protein [Halochromatium roseum]
MTRPRTDRPREVERYIARQVRKLNEPALLRLLAELRNLTTPTTGAQQ